MVDSSDKMWSTGEGNGKPLQYSCLENSMNTMKRQKDRTLKNELPRSVDDQYATGKDCRNNSTKNDEPSRSVGAQYATGDQWRNNCRKNEGMEPKQQHHPVLDVTSDGSNVPCCKEQY